MATDIERLIVSLEASTTKYERALAKANGETEKRVRSMQTRFDNLGSSASRMESRMVGSFGAVGRAMGVLGIALTTTSVISMTSAWTDLNSRVNLAAGSIDRGAAVLGRLSEMARRTYSSLEQTAEGYLQNQQALSALGYSTQQQLDLVETLNNSLVVSAVRGQRAQSVMDAWSKAMASGSLRGDNLNTIIQSGGRLSKALADSMGVSVNELRKLGEQGKITTTEMFGVTSQLEKLRLEADSMPATVSDGFVLLRDAVTQFVGEADAAVGSSSALAEAIIAVSDAISDAPDQEWFDRVFRGLGDELARTIRDGARELEYIAKILDYISNSKTEVTLGDIVTGLRDVNDAAIETDGTLAAAAGRLRDFAEKSKGVFSPEVEAAFQDLIAQLIEGGGSADLAREAIQELGEVDPKFNIVIGEVSGLINWFLHLREAATGARAAIATTTTDLGQMPSMRQIRRTFGADLTSDGAPGGPITPPSSGGGGKSPTERYGDNVADMRQRLEFLKQETALVSSLNPLLNDYGYAKERLKAIQDLENAARRAGLELGPAQREELVSLAEAYATATSDAARLAEAQKATVAQFNEIKDAARSALETIVDGFVEGKDAGDIFADVLKNIGSQLLTMGFNGLFGGGSTPGRGLFGQMFGFANGGYTGPGGKYQPAGVVHKGEVVWSQTDIARSGGVAAVEAMRRGLVMPAMPVANSDGGSVSVPISISIDATGADAAGLTRVEQRLTALQAELPGQVKNIVRAQGSKWR
ncbi:tape measure domain-containing protein [Devosia lucknowensis]|uniref:Tape measure domain-containing protein n=1 Tax=Devosia lucknowensis TaxID=1096929 RepID=A0A1Y6EXW2_9HYPH|nr:tape measure protein [Devosia lucknowensis]SMQ65850.1 tape measure domain-containing protein [Devosia lucknowensis]